MTTSNDYDRYRSQMLKLGAEFQDFIMRRLYMAGTVLNTLASPAGQQLGENLLGMEIKRDGNFRNSGNLYIEVAEKARPRNGDYAPSGIFRNDNSWLFGIGDERTFFIFALQTLRRAYGSDRRYPRVTKDTSKGMLLPIADATSMAARIFEFSEQGGIASIKIYSEDTTKPVLADAQGILFG